MSGGTRRWRSVRVRLVAAVLGLASAAVVVSGCDWTQSGFSGGRSFYNPFEPALTADTVGSLHETSTVTLPAGVVGEPIVARGAVVVSSLDPAGSTARVSSFDARTGASRWSVALPGTVVQVTDVAAYGNRLLVAVLDDGRRQVRLLSLSQHDGAVGWERSVGGGDRQLPLNLIPQLLVVKDRVMLGIRSRLEDSRQGLWPAQPRRGLRRRAVVHRRVGLRRVWTWPTMTAAPNGEVAIATGDPEFKDMPDTRRTEVFDIAGGPPISVSDGVYVTMAVGNRFLAQQLRPGQADGVAVLDVRTGELDWQAESEVVASSARFAIVSTDYDLSAVDLATGAVRWQSAGTAYRATIAGSVLYAVGRNGMTTYAMDDGHPIGELAVPSSAVPIVAGGRVHLAYGGLLHIYAPA